MMEPESDALDELVRRITPSMNPLRIILFGSAARGEMKPDSDLDILVVVEDGTDCREATRAIYRLMRGFRYPKDIVVVQESDVARWENDPGQVIHAALTEGKELYRAAS